MVTGDGLGVTFRFCLYSSMRVRVYMEIYNYPSLPSL